MELRNATISRTGKSAVSAFTTAAADGEGRGRAQHADYGVAAGDSRVGAGDCGGRFHWWGTIARERYAWCSSSLRETAKAWRFCPDFEGEALLDGSARRFRSRKPSRLNAPRLDRREQCGLAWRCGFSARTRRSLDPADQPSRTVGSPCDQSISGLTGNAAQYLSLRGA